jgi:formate-dependent nitrite reductase membrane component NrfD
MRKLLSRIVAAVSAIAAYTMLATPAFAQSYYYDSTATAADATAGVIGLAIWACICCVGLIVPLGLAYWVYKDAEKNKVENPILWAVLTFFFTLVGLLVYLLAIRPEAMKKMGGSKSEDKKE